MSTTAAAVMLPSTTSASAPSARVAPRAGALRPARAGPAARPVASPTAASNVRGLKVSGIVVGVLTKCCFDASKSHAKEKKAAAVIVDDCCVDSCTVSAVFALFFFVRR